MFHNKRLFYRMSEIKRRVEDICIQIERKNKRYYTIFESVDSLEEWYRQLSDEERTCHEVVTGERRKLIIDIDGEEDDMYEFYDFARHIVSRIRSVFIDMEIGVPDVLVYDMCSEFKISYHAIVTNMAFSANTCRGLCAIISHGQIWKNLVDYAVYKHVQHIRIEGSTKYGQRRWKNINEEDERTCCNKSLVSKNFQKSLLSNVCGIMHPSVEYIIKFTLKETVPFLCQSEILKNFKVRRVSENRVFLDRIRPSMCIKCNRVHMRENAMICAPSAGHGNREELGLSAFEYTLVCWRSL